MITTLNDTIIFALNTGLDNEEASVRNLFEYLLPEIEVQCGEGCYQNDIEQCYIVPNLPYVFMVVRKLAEVHNQESILAIGYEGQSVLHYIKSYEYTILGKMQEVGAGTAQQQAGYTHVNGLYFTVLD